MKRILGLAFTLAIFWLINSLHFTPLLLSFGVLSIAGVILIVLRMERIDDKSEPPVFLSWRIFPYLTWLIVSVYKASLEVVRHIWEREPQISPVVFDSFMLEQDMELFEVFYANSVTLTPGTMILDIEDKVLEIHALTHDAAKSLLQGEVAQQISRLSRSKQ
ncbi:MAG TPA: cation transporter [Pseudomonadaceae bacterium]|nr:cation transporter [Pseudomonadaceae bacterium]